MASLFARLRLQSRAYAWPAVRQFIPLRIKCDLPVLEGGASLKRALHLILIGSDVIEPRGLTTAPGGAYERVARSRYCTHCSSDASIPIWQFRRPPPPTRLLPP